MKTLIISGGRFQKDFAVSFLEKNKYDYVIAVDKGAAYAEELNIKPDGSFAFTESKLDIFNMDQYHECVEIFENAKAKSEDVQGILKNSDGKINIIKGTDWITLPELFAIDAELLEGNNKLRGRNKRDELLTSCLDIKCFEQNRGI